MSVLFWLFGLGGLAVAFPFLFHLIRRTPKGQTQFSSLMFLKPTPPTLTRRSRLENLLLLLLRMAVLALVALAFMRPFLRGTDSLSMDQVSSRRIAVLLDTSASMQRGDLWKQASSEVEKILAELEADDEISLLAFDDRVRSIVPFDAATGDVQSLESQRSYAVERVRESLAEMQPGWSRSDLGRALVQVADQLAIWRDSRRTENKIANSKLQMIVVSDLQKGSKTDALQTYQWPADVFVEFRQLTEPAATNATVQVLTSVEDAEQTSGRRIRVRNFENSTNEQFFVNWIDKNRRESDQPIPFYVPPGTSRVLEMEDLASLDGIEFCLSGDTDAFDNSYFVVPPQKQTLKLAYLGSEDENDPEQMLFYLTRGLAGSATRAIEVQQLAESDPLQREAQSASTPTTMAAVTSPLNENRAKEVDDFLAAGGLVLMVLKDRETAESLKRWTKATMIEPSDSQSNDRQQYAMLAEIDFTHPLFALFDSPRFNDFTKIRFWDHRRVELDSVDASDSETDSLRVIARFDDDAPAVWQVDRKAGGRVFVFASGWHPEDSQLALSTKFVPILNGILDIAVDQPEFKKSYLVNETIEFVAASSAEQRTMIKPDGSSVPVEADQTNFSDTELPGIYQLKSPDEDVTFAVNVDRAESETVAIPLEQLEMFDINVGRQKTASSELEMLRQTRDKELEDSQKLWKWLISAVLILLIVETWVAAKTSLKQHAAGDSVGGESSLDISGGVA